MTLIFNQMLIEKVDLKVVQVDKSYWAGAGNYMGCD